MRGSLRGGLRGREGMMGLGRGRMDGWQRGGDASRGGARIGFGGVNRNGIVDGGRGGIAGSGIGPLILVEGAKKLFQDVSEHTVPEFPRFRTTLMCSKDVLYLIIVQRPTDAQMATAMERMASLGQFNH
jgi:hypothetical protein